jgi:hypothetical protein
MRWRGGITVSKKAAKTSMFIAALASAVIAVACVTVFVALRGPDGGGGEATSYYQLRVELTTRSDGAELEPARTAEILSVREVGVQGKWEKKGVSMLRVWVQRDGAASAEEVVGITADYAIDPSALGRPFAFSLHAAGPEGCALRVTGAGDGEEVELAVVEHAGAEPLEFQVELSPLGGSPPLVDETESRSSSMALAFYYPWYDSTRNWDSPALQDRPAQPYVSADRAAMERHVEQAREAGIDGFLVSWWGPGSYTDENLALLLDVAEESGFSIAINFETLRGDSPAGNPQPLPPDEIFAWMRYALTSYGDHPAYLRIDGEPLIAVWASQAVPLDDWERVFAELEARGLEAFCLAEFGGDHPKTDVLEVFDGLHTYNIVGMAGGDGGMDQLASIYADTGRMVRNYHLLQEEGAPRKLWAATAQPGYDDHLIPGRPGVVLPREDGETYRASFEAALASGPDCVFITSWNEWWEHTYIEPSEAYGDLYLSITAECLGAWRE